MNAKVTASLVLIPILLASASHAAVIERDWLNEGDGLLTFDTINQRESLDVPQTLLAKFSGGYDEVVMETNPGGMFEGFTVAKSADVIALAEAAGIDTSTTSLAVNEVATRNLIELLGATDVLSGGRVGTAGVLDELVNANNEDRLVAVLQVTPQVDLAEVTVVPFSSLADDLPSRFTGVMLYREAIPEPSTIVLACYLLALLQGQRLRS